LHVAVQACTVAYTRLLPASTNEEKHLQNKYWMNVAIIKKKPMHIRLHRLSSFYIAASNTAFPLYLRQLVTVVIFLHQELLVNVFIGK
jgi:hypothetical protein